MTRPLDPGRYRTATAFYTALEARLREASNGDHMRLSVLRTQFAIARLLVRLQSTQPGQWAVKGGTSLLARLDGRCRLSRDLDVLCRDLSGAGANGLSQAAACDAYDWLRFEVGDGRPLLQEEIAGVRFRVTAWIADQQFVRFGADVVSESEMSGSLELRAPYSPVPLVGALAADVLLYPVEDHIADKLSAMGKVRQYGDRVVTSTRYRDLADLALFAASVPVAAEPLLAALAVPARHWARAAFGETGLRAPGSEWPERYATTLRSEPYVVDRWPSVESALATAKPLVDPALAGAARGTWDPVNAAWQLMAG